MKEDSRLLPKGGNQLIEAKQCTAINLAGTSRCEVFPDKMTTLITNICRSTRDLKKRIKFLEMHLSDLVIVAEHVHMDV